MALREASMALREASMAALFVSQSSTGAKLSLWSDHQTDTPL